MTDRFLFIIAPYAAAAALPAVLLVRYGLRSRRDGALRDGASRAIRIFGGSAAWRYGLLLLLAGHLIGLLFPRQVLRWNEADLRLFVFEGAAGLIGLWTLFALLALVRRNMRESGGPGAASTADLALLSLLFVQIASGLALAILYRWASSWSAVTLNPYVVSLLRLHPRLDLIAGMPYLVKLHVFAGSAVVALLPWTHLADLVLYPLHRALHWPVARAASLVLPRVDRWSRRLALSAALWPEEED
jgi:nitrate reductase gamma subunit